MTWHSKEEQTEQLAVYLQRLQEGNAERCAMVPLCLSCSGERNFKTPSSQPINPRGVYFPDDPEEVLCFRCLRDITKPQLEAAIEKWERHLGRLKKHLEEWRNER